MGDRADFIVVGSPIYNVGGQTRHPLLSMVHCHMGQEGVAERIRISDPFKRKGGKSKQFDSRGTGIQ